MDSIITTLLDGSTNRYLYSSYGTVRIVNSEKNIEIHMYKALGAKQTVILNIGKEAIITTGIIHHLLINAKSDSSGDFRLAHKALSEIVNINRSHR